MNNNNDINNDANVIDDVNPESTVTASDVTNVEGIDNTGGVKAASEQIDVEALKAALRVAEAKVTENYELALRVKAEAENTKRRQEIELSNARKFAIEKFTKELLPILDSMEMGLSASSDGNASIEKFREGTEMALGMFHTAMGKFDAVAIEPQGEKFNPDLHQAMSMVENLDVPPNTILNVVQKGYTLQGRLMRPAMVVVSKGGPPAKGSIDETV